MSVRTKIITGSITALAFAAVALPSHAMQDADAAQKAGVATIPASVIVFDQKVDANAVKLSYVYVPAKSVAVVYAEGAEKKTALGTLAVAPGDHRDLKISLADAPAKGSKLWVSLYHDKDGKADKGYWDGAQLPSENGFVVQ